jgi:hypothetical protein
MSRSRVRHRGLAVLAAFVVFGGVLTGGATASDDNGNVTLGMDLVEVTVPSRAAAVELQRRAEDLGIEFNDHYLRQNADGTWAVSVLGFEDGLARLEEAGYEIAAVIENEDTYRARMLERQAAIDAEKASFQAARGVETDLNRFGLRAGVQAQAAAGEVTILRADYFESYAGQFLSVEARTALGQPGNAGPTLSMSRNTGAGTPISTTPILMNKNTDPDTTPDTYVEHRILVRIGGINSGTPVPTRVRVGSSTGEFAEGDIKVWLGGGLPPFAAGFQQDFTTRYLDPTELYARFESLATEFPNISQIIPLPFKTNGYQRKAQATMAANVTSLQAASAAGATQIRVASLTGLAVGMRVSVDAAANQERRVITAIASPNPAAPAPNITLDRPLDLAHANAAAFLSGEIAPGNAVANSISGMAGAVVLTSRAWGHEGGNNVTAAFIDPAVPNAPLSVSAIGNDITVNLATNSAGNLISTAQQVIDAIAANAQASALVKGITYRGNAGGGVVQPRTRVNLSDFLTTATNAHVQRGPFTNKVFRIGRHRDGSRVGIFLYCQQHAREWATPLTCLETAERLLRNYGTDPTTTELVDNLDIFILPSSNPDGSHYSIHNFTQQRRNMTNWCVEGAEETDDPTAPDFWTPRINPGNGQPYTNTDPASRTAWGVDLNRNNTVGTIFDGYIGASFSCTNDTYAGIAEANEPEIKNELWIADTFSNIKFSNNIHSFGGYFMWAPGAYLTDRGEGDLVHPNIGIEGYFFDAADRILNRIKEYRGTVILPERTGPIADVLYSAAGNSADEHWYNRGVIAYSFETGADRFQTTLNQPAAAGATGIRVSSTTGLVAGNNIKVGFDGPNQELVTIASVVTPNPPSPNPNVLLTTPLANSHVAGEAVIGGNVLAEVGFQPNYANEGKHEAMEFSSGNYGLLEAALAYSRDVTPPIAEMTGPRASSSPIETTFEWVNEPSVIHYTTDGSNPTLLSPTWEAQAPRAPGEVFTIATTTTFKWIAKDLKGNVSDVRTATFAIDDQAPTTTASFSPPEQGGYYRNPTITLTAVDNGDAGIDKTEYSLDGGPTTLYAGPFQVTGDGDHTLTFASTDKAGNAEAPVTVTFKVDGTAPAISIVKPVDGASYLLGSTQRAEYSCSDALSGLASCVGSVPNGSKFFTGSVGYKTFTVNASDNAGNTSSDSVQYNVHWPFTGFLKPVENDRVNVVKAGSTVPIKFKLGGFRGWDVIADGYPQSMKVSCSAGVVTKLKGKKRNLAHHDDDDRGHGRDKGRDLDYDDGVYEFEWKTSKSWDDTCRVFVLKLEDNTVHKATFRFK